MREGCPRGHALTVRLIAEPADGLGDYGCRATPGTGDGCRCTRYMPVGAYASHVELDDELPWRAA
jgi:hypothetical protein